jgi:hypothetical protein
LLHQILLQAALSPPIRPFRYVLILPFVPPTALDPLMQYLAQRPCRHSRSGTAQGRLATVTMVLAAACLTAAAVAETDSQAPRWKVRDVDSDATIVRHQRLPETFDKPATDALRIQAGYGTQALAYLPISATRVISELHVSVPIRSDRVGLQALVRVVLPRTTDPKTNGPITVLVMGTSCQTATEWETLLVDNIPQRLQRQVRVLQLSFEKVIDVREAYVDMVLMNVYGGAGVTNVELGDPKVDGSAGIPRHGLDGASMHDVSYRTLQQEEGGGARVEGNLLYVRNRPFFLRMVDDHGEPWTLLKSLGVNTVRLGLPVSFEQLTTARQLGMWIISPPPQIQPDKNLSRHFDRVIAWDLGSDLTAAHLTSTRNAARMLRATDRQIPIPTLCGPSSAIASFGRCTDILIHHRAIPEQASGDRNDYPQWLRRRMEAASPTTVHLAAVETQPAAGTVAQAAAMGAIALPRLNVETMRRQAYAASAMGTRGIYFRSYSRLDADTPQDKHRQVAIRRINLELQLIEPWLAAGQRSSSCPIAPCLYSADALQTNRATLFVLRRKASSEASAPSHARLVIPELSETTRVYRIGAGGLVPISHRRVAGGVEVLACDADSTHPPQVVLLLVTRVESIVRDVAERINRNSAAIAKTIGRQIESEFSAELLGSGRFASAKAHEVFKAAVARQDWAAAHQLADLLLGELEHRRYRDWCAAWQALPSPTACALATYPNTIDALVRFLRAVPHTGQGLNLLGGGGCDQKSALVRAGWQTTVDQHRATGQVAISDNPYAGDGCLQLTATWSKPATNPSADDRAIMWTNTPLVSVAAGQTVRIAGWVKLEPSVESDGQLVIFDSLTGPPLGLRLSQPTDGEWQPFTMYRTAEQSSDLTVSFALTGPGTAMIDEVSVTPILFTEHLQ